MTQSFDSAPPPVQTPSSTPVPPANQQLVIAELMRRTKGGASNFFWIAALSVINTFLALAQSDTRFVVGLAVTQFIDGVAYFVGQDRPEARTIMLLIAFVIDLVIIGIFVLFGYLARKGRRWAFIAGLILYAIDAMLMLVFQDWLGFGFHLFFLWGLFNGLRALNQLQQFLPRRTSDFPQSIGVS
jgi:MFS family permease